jgi:hypothetical protein
MNEYGVQWNGSDFTTSTIVRGDYPFPSLCGGSQLALSSSVNLCPLNNMCTDLRCTQMASISLPRVPFASSLRSVCTPITIRATFSSWAALPSYHQKTDINDRRQCPTIPTLLSALSLSSSLSITSQLSKLALQSRTPNISTTIPYPRCKLSNSAWNVTALVHF